MTENSASTIVQNHLQNMFKKKEQFRWSFFYRKKNEQEKIQKQLLKTGFSH